MTGNDDAPWDLEHYRSTYPVRRHTMKRHTLLAISVALAVGCTPETITGPNSASATSELSTSTTQTTYSGRATVLEATVLGLPIRISDTGPLPETGGEREFTLLDVSVPSSETGGVLGAGAVAAHAATVGQGDRSRAEASVAELSLTVSGNTIAAGFLMSRAEAVCQAGDADISGSSEIAALVINGQEIVVSGAPNQTIDLPNGQIIINEQSRTRSGERGDITVTALHVITKDPFGNPLADVVIARSHADVTCGRCNDTGHDFLTGGGWITGTPSGKRANLAVAGGFKNGALWGHLTYIDHGPGGPRVKGTGVTSYVVVDATTRHIKGTAEIDGVAGWYDVVVSDKGEPGRSDTFTLTLSTGYTASGTLIGGNIQLHLKPSTCP